MKKYIKRLLTLTVAAAMIFSSMPLTESVFDDLFSLMANAYDDFYEGDYDENDYFEYGEYECRIEEGGKISIMKYKGSAAEVVIPSEINGYTVAYIGDYAFSPAVGTDSEGPIIEYPDCNNLVSVTIPSTVIEIGFRAFFFCENLENVNFSEGLEYIGTNAFGHCVKLSAIDLPSTLVQFDTSAFFMTAIEELVIKENPNGDCFWLDWHCFYGSSIKRVVVKGEARVRTHVFENSSVEEIVFEGKVREFSEKALEDTDNLVKKIVFKSEFPSETIELLAETFGYYYHKNHNDGSIRFDTLSYNSDYTETFTLEGFGEYAINENSEAIIFKYTGSATQITVPEEIDGHKVVEIADAAFMNSGARKVVLPSTVKYIGSNAFKDNKYLEAVEITGVEEIDYAAFRSCYWLDTIKTSESLKFVAPFAFYSCFDLIEIALEGVEIIGDKAFMKCNLLKKVTLSDYMTYIGKYAFTEANISTINIPEGIKVIKERTFYNCMSLYKVVLPTTIEEVEAYAFENCHDLNVENTGYITKLNEYSFFWCGLSSFDFNPEIKSIPDYCFYGTEFNELVVPPTIESVGKYAFAKATGDGINNIVISEGVKTIKESSFESNGQITLTLPSTLEEIPSRAFYGVTISNLVLPEGIKHIKRSAFALAKIDTLTIPESLKIFELCSFYNASVNTVYYNAINCGITGSGSMWLGFPNVTNLFIGDKVEAIPGCLFSDSRIKELVIPEGVKEIRAGAFDGSSKLTSVTLPTTLKTIGARAFRDCIALKEFTVPKGVTSLHATAFDGCTALETIYFNAKNCEFANLTVGTNNVYRSPFYNLKSLKKIVLADSARSVPAYLLSQLEVDVELVMSDSVRDIGDYAFYSNKILTEIKFPANLESIGIYSFAYCDQLEAIELPDTLEIIDNYAFYNCKKIESITLPDSIIYLGSSVFTKCSGLKSFVFGADINTVPSGLFEGCTSLEDVYISDSVVRLDERAFYKCESLKSVRMSSNVSYIPREAFYYCTSLTDFTWDAQSKHIGKLAFAYCKSLSEFDFTNVEKLYENSFLHSGVTVVQLGETKAATASALEEVEEQSFMECENLETVGVGGNVSTIKTQAFAECPNLETVVIADSVTEIAEDAFEGCDNLTIYCSEDSYAYSYAMEQGITVSTLVIAPIPNQTYTGFEIKPEVSVSAYGDALEKNVDFSVSYANNVNVGNADVKVKGKGDFRMFSSEANFTIVTKHISDVKVASVADQPYTGQAVKPKLTVTDGIIYLVEGKDYTVTYYNNVNEGRATVKLTGKGNYSGFTTTSFAISENAKELNAFEQFMAKLEDFFARFFSQFARMFR